MYRSKTRNERIVHRYRISLGHFKKVVAMAEEGTYCMDVLLQSQAVQNAIKETDALLLEHHLHTCASDAIKKGRGSQAVREIVQIFKKRP